MRRTLLHNAWLMPVVVIGVLATGRAPAAELRFSGVQLVEGYATTRSVTLGKGKSLEFDFPRDIKDVLVADPKIANAVVRTSRRAYIIAIENGATNISFFDAEGRQIIKFDIAVSPDVNVIRAALRKMLPGADVKVEAIGDGIMLTGTVSSPAEAQQACDIASHFIGGTPYSAGGGFSSQGQYTSNTTVSGTGGSNGQQYSSTSNSTSGGASGSCRLDKVVNAIVVRERDEVMLKVTVAELDRTVIKQLGINLNGSLGTGTAVVKFDTNNPFPINGTAPSNSIVGSFGGPGNNLRVALQAMDQVGLTRVLAEPTLTAISGESAHFLAGGKFPYPSVTSCTVPPCPPTIQFQNFGVALTFTPVVLSEGRISLHVSTEISELNPQNSVSVAGTSVPGLNVRTADSTVEIPSGGTLAMAGMLQEETKQAISGVPGLQQLPILGVLFKSRDYQNNRTELAVLVTPYIVRAVAQKELSRPDDGFADPSDPASEFLGRLNRIYGVRATKAPTLPYYGKIGFIID
jgi:pilus assembly protein CpaC